MSTARSLVRWLLVGRRDGLRAALRRRLGWLTWLDRRRGPGAAPTTPEAPSTAPATVEAPADGEWTDLCAVDELEPDEVAEVLVGERPIAVACVGGAGGARFHAVDGVCPHAGGPLGDGVVEGGHLTCPWHGWSYDLATGRSTVDPEVRVPTFDVRVQGGRVQARLRVTGPTA
jgi:nitrite reductase/ring-hydroxylating ferredoxin subunit